MDDGQTPRVTLIVDAGTMHVLDPKLSAANRIDVQTRMLGAEVLDANRFAQMRFESSAINRAGPAGWTVR